MTENIYVVKVKLENNIQIINIGFNLDQANEIVRQVLSANPTLNAIDIWVEEFIFKKSIKTIDFNASI